MVRWEPDGRGRLEEAALELFGECGFEQTTVAEIAARAGLTERTFYRHFADKREVLFAGGEPLQELLVGEVLAAPASAPPLDALAAALRAASVILQERPDHVRRRQRVISANPELRERELIKLAAFGDALAAALRSRGVAEPAAALSAEMAMSVFRLGVERWSADPGRADLETVVLGALDDLRGLAAGAAR